MHTVWVRLNAVVSFGLTALLGFTVLSALSKYGHANRVKPVILKLSLNTLQSLRSHSGVDRAHLSFDIDADFRPAFHWNSKHIFVFVIADYKTDSNPKNQVVLWDVILNATDPDESKIIRRDNVFVKYGLVDQTNELRGKVVELQLHWDHIPLTGCLNHNYQSRDTMNSFKLPEEYH